MALFGFGKKVIVCPECRTRGAVKTFTGVKCRNPGCPKYDPSIGSISPESLPVTTRPGAVFHGNFDPGPNATTIRYRNYRGEDAEYVVDKTSIRSKHEHITAQALPTGKRIALAKQFIQNLPDVPEIAQAEAGPSGNERRILSFHLKRGSTSPLFEELRRKYPDWKPE